jgi:copper transport protein
MAAVVAAVAACAVPASAQGHAVLERTVPERGASPATPPDEVALYFNEPVEASFGAIRVFDAEGSEVETGELQRPGGGSDAISVSLPGELPDGGYTVTYRVISADSHPISGGFVFSIGQGGQTQGATVSELLEDSEAGDVTDVAFWVARFAGYLALGLAVGLAGFVLLVLRPAFRRLGEDSGAWAGATGTVERRAGSLLLWVAAGGVLASIATLVLQGATAAGTSFWSALDPDVIREVIDTRYGLIAVLRAAAFLLIGAVALIRLPFPLLLLPIALLVAAPALSGHASTQDPVALLFPANVVHVLAMGLWFGGLAALLTVLPAATRGLEPPERSAALAACLARFSPIALGSVLALVASGTVQSIVYLGPLADLLDTGFGRAVLIKATLLIALVGLGALNRRRLLPGLERVAARREAPGQTGVLLRRSLRAEVLLIAGALGVTAALVASQPPADAVSGPVSGSSTLGDAVLDYTVDPARPGSNEMHLYLFDAEDGSQFDSAKEVTASLEQAEMGIGPIEAELRRAAPGHYVAPDAPFGVPGDWTVEIAMRVSRFSESRVTFEVPIK